MGDGGLMLSVSGCRGVMGAGLTPASACRYAGAAAQWFREVAGDRASGTVVLGRDGRVGGEPIRLAATAQLLACGFRVIDLGVATTPTVGLMTRRYEADGGLVITASHNPAEWNGLKPISSEGSAPPPSEAQRIISLFHDGAAPLVGYAHVGRVGADDTAAHAHVAAALNALERVVSIETIRHKRFRVAVDSVNGAGRVAARLLMDALGCELVHINAEETGVFPRQPEPTEENLSTPGGLCEMTAERGCDVGFAQDPDADRLAIVDERGRCVGEEATLALAAEALLSTGAAGEGATIAVNLSTSRMIEDIAERCGARVVRTPVGEANVAEAMRREGCALGGEGNGGVIWPEVVMIRDSVAAMALTLALMAAREQTVSSFTAALPRYEIRKRKATVEPERLPKAMDAVAARWSDIDVDRRDGVRLDFAEQRAWLHVRPSNTEPVVRLIAEAPTADRAEALLDEAERVVVSG